MSSILPTAETTFFDNNGVPLAAGSVFFYIPGTTTPKTTYQDQAQTIPNTNPVILDGAGRAQIWGTGSYRQIVKDISGNTIWDQVTADTSLSSSITFQAPGTGSISRTLTSKLGDVLTVKDYNAKGDGVTNDVAALAAADAQNALVFPIGVYRVSTNLQLNSQALFLPGAQVTVDAGVVLTFLQPPVGQENGTFAGVGKVIGGGIDRVSVFQWFNFTQISDVLGRTGAVECAPAIQSAITAMQGTGKVLYFPAGVYKVSSAITVSGALRMEGDSILKDWTTTTSGIKPPLPVSGTVMAVYTPSNPPSVIAQFLVTADNVYMENFDFVSMVQNTPGGGWVPVATVGAVTVLGNVTGLTGNCPTFRDIMVRGLSYGLTCLGPSLGRVDIDGLYGQAWTALLYLDGVTDVAHVQSVHDWPFWSADANISAWTFSNGTHCAYLGRVDEPVLDDIFATQVQYGIGFHDTLVAGMTGSVTWLIASNLNFDGVQFGLASFCTSGASSPQGMISNLLHFGFSTPAATYGNSACVIDFPGTRPLELFITNLSTSSLGHEGIKLANAGSVVQLSNLLINTWNTDNVGAPAINVAAGATVLIGTGQIVGGAFGAPATGGAGTVSGTYFGGGGGGVSSFNGRVGAISLTSNDVVTALTYQPPKFYSGTTIAAAGVTDVGTTLNNMVTISGGSTTINSLGASAGTADTLYLLTCTNSQTFHNSVSLQCPGGVDLVVGAGQSFFARSVTAGNWVIDNLANLLAGGGGVSTFNGRAGAVTLSSADVVGALTYQPPKFYPGSAVAAAGTTDVGTAQNNLVTISGGSTTINSLGNTAGATDVLYYLICTASQTFHNSASLQCPGGVDLVVAANSAVFARSVSAGNWVIDFVANSVTGGAGVTTFNGRGGVVTLTTGDVTTALGYTPVQSVGSGSNISVGGTAQNPSINLNASPTLAGTVTATSFAVTGAAGAIAQSSGSYTVATNWLPAADNTYQCGTNFGPDAWSQVASHAFNTVSDRRWKTDIRPLELGLDFVLKLQPKWARWRTGTNHDQNAQFIAQDVEQALEGVEFGGLKTPAHKLGRYGLDYTQFVPVLAKAIQEQQAFIDAILKRLAILEENNDNALGRRS